MSSWNNLIASVSDFVQHNQERLTYTGRVPR